MAAIERDNKALKGVLPKNYARPGLNKARLGELIDLIATIGWRARARRRSVRGIASSVLNRATSFREIHCPLLIRAW